MNYRLGIVTDMKLQKEYQNQFNKVMEDFITKLPKKELVQFGTRFMSPEMRFIDESWVNDEVRDKFCCRFRCHSISADWNEYGMLASSKRMERMAEYTDPDGDDEWRGYIFIIHQEGKELTEDMDYIINYANSLHSKTLKIEIKTYKGVE